MKLRSQEDFFKDDREFGPNRSSHGGQDVKGRRRVSRPFKKNQAHHLVLKSSAATGNLSMLGPRFKVKIDELIEKYARRFNVTLHAKQNVGNHIHLMAKAPRKSFLQDFLRTTSGVIARLVTGAKRGKPFGQKFWDEVAYSRVIHGPRDFAAMLNYIYKNYLEAEVKAEARESVEKAEAALRKKRRKGRAGINRP